MSVRLKKCLSEDFKYSEKCQGDKLLYLGDYVFMFTTYVDEYSKHFAGAMVRTLRRIQDQTNFEFIEASQENHLEYLQTVNTPFLHDKLDWGTSIRGAWFSHDSKIKVWDNEKEEEFEMLFLDYVRELLEWYDTPEEIVIEEI